MNIKNWNFLSLEKVKGKILNFPFFNIQSWLKTVTKIGNSSRYCLFSISSMIKLREKRKLQLLHIGKI